MILCDVSDEILKKSLIAAMYGIRISTLSTTNKNWEHIETACAVNQFEPARKQRRTTKNEEVEVALLRGIRETRNLNIILTGAVLQEKAKLFAEALDVNGFTVDIICNLWYLCFSDLFSKSS